MQQHVLPLQFAERVSLDEDAIRLAEISDEALRRQIKFGGWSIALSFLGSCVMLAFLRWGPSFSETATTLSVAIFVMFTAVFVVAVPTTLGPLTTAFALHDIRIGQEMLERAEVEEELEEHERNAAIAVEVLTKLSKNATVSGSEEFQKLKPKIDELLKRNHFGASVT